MGGIVNEKEEENSQMKLKIEETEEVHQQKNNLKLKNEELEQTNEQSDSTQIENIKTGGIIILSIIVLFFVIKWGWKRMSAKYGGSQCFQDANSENSENIENGGCLAEVIPKAMGRNRGKKAKKRQLDFDVYLVLYYQNLSFLLTNHFIDQYAL